MRKTLLSGGIQVGVVAATAWLSSVALWVSLHAQKLEIGVFLKILPRVRHAIQMTITFYDIIFMRQEGWNADVYANRWRSVKHCWQQ